MPASPIKKCGCLVFAIAGVYFAISAVREMGLMAVLRMLGRRPQDIGGVDRVTGYCPIRRFTKFDAIRDSQRWPEINAKLTKWIEEVTTSNP